METTIVKTKREKFSFFGFIFLAIGFIGLLVYGNYMNNILDKKARTIKGQEIQLKAEQEKFEVQKKANSQLTNLIPIEDSLKVNNILENSKSQINTIETVTILEANNDIKSVVYIQVGSNKTLVHLKKVDFINKISSNEYRIIDAYDLEEGKANNQIRYFNEQDKVLAENLSTIIREKFPNIILTPKHVKFSNKTKIPAGQLEVWIK